THEPTAQRTHTHTHAHTHTHTHTLTRLNEDEFFGLGADLVGGCAVVAPKVILRFRGHLQERGHNGEDLFLIHTRTRTHTHTHTHAHTHTHTHTFPIQHETQTQGGEPPLVYFTIKTLCSRYEQRCLFGALLLHR